MRLEDTSSPAPIVTKRGCQIRRPARFSVITDDTPEGLSFKGGGSCEARIDISRETEERQSHASSPPQRV